MDKRQCTVQLTVFADGEPRVKPLLIFKGTGARIALRERVSETCCVCVCVCVCKLVHTENVCYFSVFLITFYRYAMIGE